MSNTPTPPVSADLLALLTDYTGWASTTTAAACGAVMATNGLTAQSLPDAERALLTHLAALERDKERLDWIESQSGYTGTWVARQSTTGRGFRLHNTSGADHPTARAAIDAARQAEGAET